MTTKLKSEKGKKKDGCATKETNRKQQERYGEHASEKDRSETYSEIADDEFDENKQELDEHKSELVQGNQLEKDLNKYVERACAEHNKLNNKSAHVEARYGALAENSKNKLRRIVLNQKEEEHVEAEDKKTETEDEHVLDARMDFFEDGSDFLCRMFDGRATCELHFFRKEAN